MIFIIVVGALVAGAGTAWVASDDVRYLARAGLEEIHILQSRESIAAMVADSSTPPELRRSLSLVLDARDFADSLGLDAASTYTTYSDIGRDTLLLVLQASPRDCLCPYVWKWPIVGRMPYKGFFDVEAARREAGRLADQGYDIYLRPSGAFSTLGWFEDPLLSTALSADPVELVATVFHEIAHNSLYVKSATPFNESFAQMMGYRSAERFFLSRGDSVAARRAADRWHDEQVFGEFYGELTERLQTLYALKLDSAGVDSGRVAEGSWARAQLEGPVRDSIRTFRIGPVRDQPVNNARLVGAMIYRTNLEQFEMFFQQHGGDVTRTLHGLQQLVAGAEGDEAFSRLAEAVTDG
ncbi:MAG TPA: aminopeptidase [Gemmatimonadales bacterium]|nr:aminopeptidase [Gemmatimonadales bacterium]